MRLYYFLWSYCIYIYIYTHKQYNFSPVRIIADPSRFHIIHKFENGDFILCAIACQLSGRPKPAVWGCQLSGQQPSLAQPSPASSPAQSSPTSPAQPSPASQPSPAQPSPAQPAQPSPALPASQPRLEALQKAAQQQSWQKSGRNPAEIRHKQKSGIAGECLKNRFCQKNISKKPSFLTIVFATCPWQKSGRNPAEIWQKPNQ